MEAIEIKSCITINNPLLLRQIKNHLKKYSAEQKEGYAANLGIVLGIVIQKDTYILCSLSPFQLIQKISSYFKQVFEASIQYGDMGFRNKDGQTNDDVPTNHGRKCWANGYVSERLSVFSRSF